MRMKIVRLVFKLRLKFLISFLYKLYGCSFKLKNKKQNRLILNPTVLLKTKIKSSGTNNTIEIKGKSFIEKSNISVRGNNNKIIIGENSYINQLRIVLDGNNNTLEIGDNFFITGDSHFCVLDGSSLTFGKDCMLSDKIDIRTTDNHSIYDLDTGKRINFEKDVKIGNHVWIGTGAMVLKGAVIPDNCIIGAKSMITKAFDTPNCCIVGTNNVVKHNVTWTMERAPELPKNNT